VAPLDRSTLEGQIRTAFQDEVLGNGIGLRETQIIDRYGDEISEAELAKLPKDEVKDDWSRVPLDEYSTGCIAHLDAEGLRYYLPALLLSVLDDYDAGSMRVIGTLSAIDPRGAYGEKRFVLLNQEQRCAVAEFLSSLPQLVELWHEDSKLVARSLSAYWHQYLSPPNKSLERTRER
jgi:uncharacterized protein DUF6714